MKQLKSWSAVAIVISIAVYLFRSFKYDLMWQRCLDSNMTDSEAYAYVNHFSHDWDFFWVLIWLLLVYVLYRICRNLREVDYIKKNTEKLGNWVGRSPLFCYFLECYKNYLGFSGRARRKEFWGFMLFYTLIVVLLYIIADIFKPQYTFIQMLHHKIPTKFYLYPLKLFFWVSIVPLIAVSVRRLHDVGRSGWRLLLAIFTIIPIFGLLFLMYFLYLFFKAGDPFENDYGVNPKGEIDEF